MAAPVIIRVGCALDTSVEKTFSDFEKRAMRAGVRAQAALAKAGRGGLGSGQGGATGAAEQAERRYTRAVEAESAKRLRSFRAEARMRRQVLGEEERDLLKSVRAEEKARERADRNAARMARAQSRELDRFATRTSHRATRFLWPNAPLASMGRRAGADIMRGLGVDTSLAGTIGRGRDLERSATALGTAGYISGAEGPAGKRVAAGDLMGEARKVGAEFALDPQQVIDAQDQFVKLTGNLDVARKMMGELAGMSIATGSDMTELATAAGELSNALGDMPEAEKAKALQSALRSLASQGKIGSVEIRDYARYMAHLGGAVGQFGGDRGTRIAQFGALTQLAKSYGGGTSAAVATRSISGFANTLSTPARRAKFKEYGVDIEDDRGLFRDPLQILRDAISKTGGKTEPLKEMFANVIGSKPVTALSNIYKQAGGGDAGMAAIDKELAKQMNAFSMTSSAINEAVGEYKETTGAKAQEFQNKLDEIADKAAGKLLPALEQLAPVALKVAEGMGTFAQWLAENPGKAIGLAISTSIARAGLESAFRAGIERMIVGAAGGTAPGAKAGAAGGFMPAGGALGIAGAALTITATAVTLYATGQMVMDQLFDALDSRYGKEVGKDVKDTTDAQAIIRRARETGEITEGDQQKLLKLEEEKKRKLAAAEEIRGNVSTSDKLMYAAGSAGRIVGGVLGGRGIDAISQEQQAYRAAAEKGNIDELRNELRLVADTLRSGIRVTNITDARTPPAGPTVPPDGREPPGGG